MKYLLFLFFFLFKAGYSYSQATDSLKKYAYFIRGIDFFSDSLFNAQGSGFFMKNGISKRKKEIFIFGFPGYQNYTPFGYKIKDGLILKINSYSIKENYLYRYKGENAKIDSINYDVILKDTMNYDSLRGYSGSP